MRGVKTGASKDEKKTEVASSILGLLVLGAGLIWAADGKPDLSGTWKLDPARTDSGASEHNLTLNIEDRGRDIHVKETRGPNPGEDITEFTCGEMGKECTTQDGWDKASVSVYYNGPVLVVLKTHRRKACTVEKRRFPLASTGNSLFVEVLPIEPDGKPGKLVFSKVP